MKNTVDLNKFVGWAKKGSDRTVTIDINKLNLDKHLSIWVYDYSLMQGQHVESVEDINLGEAKRKKELELYKRLKAKFGDTHNE